MEIIYGYPRPGRFHNSVVAIGVFDGVHRGHTKILKAAARKAKKIKAKSLCLTFYPHPRKEMALYSLAHRLRLIGSLGIDSCVVLKFSRYFSAMSAPQFAEEVLMKRLGARLVYVGEGFRFARKASAGVKTLMAIAKKFSFQVRIYRNLEHKGKVISSTVIRKLIRKGELKNAAYLLGRPVSVLGAVIRGSLLGRKIGFPTANIDPHHEVMPPKGVYSVNALLESRTYRGLCYIGSRPTITKSKQKEQTNVEVHLINFKREIYGSDLLIEFVKKIREEKKFSSPLHLAAQIERDISSI